MSWSYGELFPDADHFLRWLHGKQTSHITSVHVHHTYSPSHRDFNGKNQRALQDGMRRYHVEHRGFQDIAQHITIFPDGSIMTGRNINIAPASATGYNDSDADGRHPFMFEMIGNFDVGHDKLMGSQLTSAVQVTSYFVQKGAEIRFHNQCLIHGKSPKSCPGTGVNYDWFVALVKQSCSPSNTVPSVARFQYPGHLMQVGSTGEVVKLIQKKLGGLEVDGIFGSKTKAAVEKFQQLHGLEADGMVGPITWDTLMG